MVRSSRPRAADSKSATVISSSVRGSVVVPISDSGRRGLGQRTGEEVAQRGPVRGFGGPLVLQVLGHVVLGHQLGTAIVAYHRMQVPALVRALRVALRDPPDRDVERVRSEEHTSELQSQSNLVCRLLLEKKKN